MFWYLKVNNVTCMMYANQSIVEQQTHVGVRHFRLTLKTFNFFLSVNHALDICWSLSGGSPARDPPTHALHKVGDIVVCRNFMLDPRSSCVSSRTDVQRWRSCRVQPSNIILCEEWVDEITFQFLAYRSANSLSKEKIRSTVCLWFWVVHKNRWIAYRSVETSSNGVRIIRDGDRTARITYNCTLYCSFYHW